MDLREPSGLRILVVAAHPDDEIMWAGALLRRLSLAGARIGMIHVTDGAPKDGRDAIAHGFSSTQAYARARRRELERAVFEAQVACGRYVSLEVSDQTAVYALVEITRALARHLRSHPPDVILTHAFEGGHPDHDASAFAVHGAVRLLQTQAAPAIVEFAGYHIGPGGIETGTFLAGSGVERAVIRLSAEERHVKQRARDCFVSQAATLATISLETESFRPAPRYHFDRRPHSGRLLYDYFDWGLRGDDWDRLASTALTSLRFR